MNETSSLKAGVLFYCTLLEVLECHCASPARKAVDCVICHPRRMKIKHKGNWLINQSYFWNGDRLVCKIQRWDLSALTTYRDYLITCHVYLQIHSFCFFCLFFFYSTTFHRCDTLRATVSTQEARIALLTDTKSLHTYPLTPQQTLTRALRWG